MAGRLIRIENLTKSRIGIPLKDGSHISLLPRGEHGFGSISKPFSEDLFPDIPSNNLMLQKNMIRKIYVDE
ncbi:MAG: hypothetical protein ACP5RW_09070 [bacterium]